MRHASIIDNTLPDAVIGRAHGLGLRFVLKRELRMLADDRHRRRLGADGVRRTAGRATPSASSALLRALRRRPRARRGRAHLPRGDAAHATKLARAQEIIRERQPEVAPLADRLRHMLPPRLGGPLALLEAARGTDVVFCGHVGLDGFEYISDIWAGGLVGTAVKVRFWRHGAAEVPGRARRADALALRALAGARRLGRRSRADLA